MKRKFDRWRLACGMVGGLCFTGLLFAASPGGTAPAQDVIRVGTYENPPRIYTSPDGKVTGFIPTILENIAQQERWSIKYVPCDWQRCLDLLASGEIDMMMDTVISPERREGFDFNGETVLITWAAVYTRPDLKVESLFDLSGRRIALLKGGIYTSGSASLRALLDKFNISAHYVEVPSYQDVFRALAAQKADVGAVTNTFGTFFEKQYNVARSPIVFSPSQVRFAFPKNSSLQKRMTPILDKRLRALKADRGSIYYRAMDTFLYGVTQDVPRALIDWRGALSAKERAWIENHPQIRLGADPEFYPFEFRGKNGEHQGIASDYVQLLNNRLGLNLKIVPAINWAQSVYGLEHGQIDVLPCVGMTQERAKFANFTNPYILFQRVILTRVDKLHVSGLSDIKSLRVGVQANSSHQGFLREHGFKPIEYATLEDCLLALSSGKTDAAVVNLASAAYWIRLLNLANLKVAAPASPELGSLHFAVRKDWPELVTILNKGLNMVTPDERRVIEQCWIAVDYKPGIEPHVIWRIGLRVAAAVILILALILAWTVRLKKEITQRRKIEQLLAVAKEHAESADRIKSAFLATMSHELRTPLNSIIGFTGILLQKLPGPLNPEQNKQLDMVRTSARHLLALVNDVLDISKIEAGQFNVEREAFDVHRSINKVLALISPQIEAKHLTLRVQVPPTLGEAISDERRIEQILLNLLSNAIKFTPQGEVALSAELNNDFIFPGVASGQPALCIRISDSGIGIKPEDLPLLFQPFRQIDPGLSRSHEGTGLGLAICHRLATLMGGIVSVESQWGKGSTFILILPMHAPVKS